MNWHIYLKPIKVKEPTFAVLPMSVQYRWYGPVRLVIETWIARGSIGPSVLCVDTLCWYTGTD